MTRPRLLIITFLIATLPAFAQGFSSRPADGCSAFALKTPLSCLYGTNCDNTFTSMQLFVNKRGIAKTGLEKSADGRTAAWTSRYGSLTFNLVGWQMPWGGMNETGLAVAGLNLPQTRHAAPDDRPPLTAPFWVQYVLDTCATIADVRATLAKVRISDGGDHYLVCDKNGDVMVVEFLDGKASYRFGKDLPVPVLENSLYGEQADGWLKRNSYIETTRFAAMADALGKRDKFADTEALVHYAFYVLSLVDGDFYTVVSVVFDNRNLSAYFVSLKNRDVRRVDFNRLDFSPAAPALMLDVHAPLSGNISGSLQPFSHKEAFEQYRNAVYHWGGNDLSEEKIEAYFRHLEGFSPEPAGR